MSSDGPASGPAAAVLEVLRDPETGRERLPRLLALLDTADRQQRIAGAWAVTLVADACPETVEPLARRLLDRLDDDPTTEVHLAYAYLSDRYPETTSAVADVVAADTSGLERPRLRDQPGPGGRTRGPTVDRGVGRTRLAGADVDDDPRRAYAAEGHEIAGPPEDAVGEAARRGSRTGGAVHAGTDATTTTRHRRAAELAAAAEAVGLDRIVDRSQFEHLTLVALPVEGRYADIYRTRVVWEDTEEGIALQTFHPPDGAGRAFVAALTDGLESWAALCDHDRVVSLYDWAVRPHPWMATEYTTTTLYDRTDVAPAEALWNGLKLAETIAHAHEHGVVHTGLDPYSVVYTDAVLDARQKPLVAHFGLLDAVRDHVGPNGYLDPRYAAPEYYDTDFGSVDQATDIYQLGAVLYRLVTGRHPFDGDYDSVRAAVVDATPPLPTEVDPELPDWVDDVIQKALAKQKLTRYESATQFAHDLRRELED